MWKWVILYFAGQVILLAVLILISRFTDKRYKSSESEIPAGFVKTDEVSIDPISGEKTRVFYNELTGERIYIKE
ncbi:hypothetical protein JOC78_002193 [Bacillus ectoiniformans]|uniref:hypothetical protein n=1 Tax=Bacillus ectoiniformans TaxID=1494429 RepID=UPI001956AB28|nr:hypothetical protein [Bacillus ectoiniformans]MBM7649240.1 hypothetical protein [Bacillus ectoiniformans]